MLKLKSSRLEGRRIALCISGSIAAIESPKLARELRRHGAGVVGFLTGDAQAIIHPNVIEFATGSKPVSELTGKLEHLEKFDLILIAPATANIIAKIAHGIADNAVATLCASNSLEKLLIAPAMHGEMLSNKALQKNIQTLKKAGCTIIEPKIEEGAAKLAEIDKIVDFVIRKATKQSLKGKKVLITAGATFEYFDPVRIITNLSSGKTGIALAKEAFYRGAEVKLIHGLTRVNYDIKSKEHLNPTYTESLDEMSGTIKKEKSIDFFVCAAAIGDFKTDKHKEKISSDKSIKIELHPAKKIISEAKAKVKIAFKAEHNVTEKRLLEAAREIIERGDADIVFANDVHKTKIGGDEIAGFIVTATHEKEIKKCKKEKFAEIFWDEILSCGNEQ